MRRRTTHYLALLCFAAVALYLYSVPPSRWSHQDPFTYDDPESLDGDDTPDSWIPQRRLAADIPKRDAIVKAFKYHPRSQSGTNLSHSGGIGYTIVDAIDTMWLMDLQDEYAHARDWVRASLRFDRDGRKRCFNTFETTIRVLGGLLSAFHLSSDTLYLHHAVDLADRLLPAFDTPSGLPLSSVNLETRVGIPNQYNQNEISTAEATTLQLEFRYLAQLTKNATYWHTAEKAMAVVDRARLPSNLAPISMNKEDGTYMQSEIRLGSRGDSYYEYLLKQYLQTDRTEPVYLKMYTDAVQGIHDHLIQQTPVKKTTYTAELLPQGGPDWRTSWRVQHKQDHLVCFLAGALMLGATTAGARGTAVSVPPDMGELTKEGRRDWKTGVALLDGCLETHRTATGLSPEIAYWLPDPNQPDREWHIKGSYDARYMLRPETVESLFIAWRLTGDVRYRTAAWGIFQAIEKHCRLPSGYATVLDVDTVPVRHDDKQETFFLSETLKYLFLTFADERVLTLKGACGVSNRSCAARLTDLMAVQAHPLPVFRPSIKPQFTL
ncbi:glycoside hydrolase [Mycena pura]|uniref:alpha-1,2-Mannosidase n=1 Tax=Mycena pura TaxID=153505 RepID=A0AAD6YMU8_9AGAR|nr:glycoside hydrolase [Mycena pura]